MKEKGIRGLYSGLSVTLMEIVPYAALQFGFYDAFTAAYASTRRHINPEVGQYDWDFISLTSCFLEPLAAEYRSSARTDKHWVYCDAL